MSSIGDFQADVGYASSAYNLIVSIMIGSIFILVGFMVILFSYSCKTPDECETKKKKRAGDIVTGVILIVIGLILIFGSYFLNKLVRSNKTAAQLQGTATEINLFKKIF
jgi:hypothetical protein